MSGSKEAPRDSEGDALSSQLKRSRKELAIEVMKRSWFPVARSDDLGTPQAATLLSKDLAVFRADDGTPHVMDRRCPHRGGDLSSGQVRGANLACSYHGWRYSGEDGRCVLIPSLEDQRQISVGCRVAVYPAVERFAHVWTVLDSVNPPTFPEEWEQLDLDWLAGEPIESPTGLAVAIENFADVAHFPFVHAISMGPSEEVVEKLNVRREGMHVYMDRPLSATAGPWGSQGACMMRYHIVAPGVISLMYDYEDLGKRIVAGFPSPVAYDQIRIFWGVANERSFRGESLETCLKLETDVYLEDVPVVSHISPREVPWDNEMKEWSVPADRFTLAYRRAFIELMNGVRQDPRESVG